MHIERVQARQGHEVPKQAGYARGPFPSELFTQPEIVYPRRQAPDENESDVSENFISQGDSQEWKWYRCEDCRWVLREDELDSHMCDPDDYEDDEYYDDFDDDDEDLDDDEDEDEDEDDEDDDV